MMKNHRSIMKNLIVLNCIALVWLLQAQMVQAALIIKAAEPKIYGQKTIVKMDMWNTFTNTIESARAVVFLLDDNGKVVGQETRWIIGGTKERPTLAPDAKMTFNFVVQANKPFTNTKIKVTRIVLEGGKLADVNKVVEIQLEAE